MITFYNRKINRLSIKTNKHSCTTYNPLNHEEAELCVST